MVQLSNKTVLLIFILFLTCQSASSQQKSKNEGDYKDPRQFDEFTKRRHIVSAWQVNELKEGALVLRLKTSKVLIDGLIKQDNRDLAQKKLLEQFVVNKNTMMAYLDHFKFCKVYFIYSNSSDSLMNGIRSGIFLDTNLRIDPAIVLKEKFYLLAERDYVYNSTIGFVPEDSARRATERGTPTKEMAVVIKNKYGHQLKNPFPHFVKEKNYLNSSHAFPVSITHSSDGTSQIHYYVNKTYLQDLASNEKKTFSAQTRIPAGMTPVEIKKHFTYEKITEAVQQLEEDLIRYYQRSPRPDLNRINPAVKPFLY